MIPNLWVHSSAPPSILQSALSRVSILPAHLMKHTLIGSINKVHEGNTIVPMKESICVSTNVLIYESTNGAYNSRWNKAFEKASGSLSDTAFNCPFGKFGKLSEGSIKAPFNGACNGAFYGQHTFLLEIRASESSGLKTHRLSSSKREVKLPRMEGSTKSGHPHSMGQGDDPKPDPAYHVDRFHL